MIAQMAERELNMAERPINRGFVAWEVAMQEKRLLARRSRWPWRLYLLVIGLAGGVIGLWLASLIFGCVQPGAATVQPGAVQAHIPIASPSITYAPAPATSQPQHAETGPISVAGEGNKTVTIPINVNGSAWGIVGVAVVAGGVFYMLRREKVKTKVLVQSIDAMGEGPQRNKLLGTIDSSSRVAGVHKAIGQAAKKAGAYVKRSKGE